MKLDIANKYEETNIFPCGENIAHDKRYTQKNKYDIINEKKENVW